MSKLSLSVVINTKNSEATLEKALTSVASFATQIVVMDMLSDDQTARIAKKYGVDFFSTKKDFSYVEPARNAALEKATQPWILILDADEEITPGLKKVIEEKMKNSQIETSCYFLPRTNEIFNHRMTGTGWWPDYQMRLFKRGSVSWTDQIHSVPEIHGQVEYLDADPDSAILHHNFQSVNQFIDRLNRYTTIEAQSDQILSEKDFSTKKVFDSFSDELIRRFFQENGIDEGMHGLSLSLLQANYQLVTYLKKWEIAKFPATENDQVLAIKQIRKFQGVLNYWIANWQVNHTSGLLKFFWILRRKCKM